MNSLNNSSAHQRRSGDERGVEGRGTEGIEGREESREGDNQEEGRIVGRGESLIPNDRVKLIWNRNRRVMALFMPNKHEKIVCTKRERMKWDRSKSEKKEGERGGHLYWNGSRKKREPPVCEFCAVGVTFLSPVYFNSPKTKLASMMYLWSAFFSQQEKNILAKNKAKFSIKVRVENFT